MVEELSRNYGNVLQDLKEKIRQARLRATLAVNNELLKVYWEIGDTIKNQEQNEGWGKKIIDRLASDLRLEFQDMKGLSPRNLRYTRDFARAHPQFAILQQNVATSKIDENQPSIILQRCVAKLPWGHNCTILDKLNLVEERLFYAQKAVQNGWTRDMLVNQIEGQLFSRQGALTNNFGVVLPAYESGLALQLFKDPYHLGFRQAWGRSHRKRFRERIDEPYNKIIDGIGGWFCISRTAKKIGGRRK